MYDIFNFWGKYYQESLCRCQKSDQNVNSSQSDTEIKRTTTRQVNNSPPRSHFFVFISKKKTKTQKLNSQRAAAHIRKFKDFNIEAKKSIQDTKERQQQEVYGGRL